MAKSKFSIFKSSSYLSNRFNFFAPVNVLVEIVKEQEIISHDEIEKLQRWREDPEDWM